MITRHPKFTFKKIHPDTVVTQLEFLKSDKRAKSYEELKNGKMAQLGLLLSVCHSEFRIDNRNSGCFQPEFRFPHPDFQFAADRFEN